MFFLFFEFPIIFRALFHSVFTPVASILPSQRIYIDIFIDIFVDIYIDVFTDVYLDFFIDVYLDFFIDIYLDFFIDI